MNKILVKVNDINIFKYPSISKCDGFILALDKFSYLFGKSFNIDEIKDIKNKFNDKEIFVCANKIIFNDELEEYKKCLCYLDEIGLSGIIVGDIAGITYNLKTNVILDQMHLNNSYYTINHYYNNNVAGVILTNDITKEEIDEIRKNTKALLFKQVFGYPHLSTSNRKLITNYKTKFNIKNDSKVYNMVEVGKSDYYKIIEDDFGCHIFGCKPINLLNENINVDYKIFDDMFIDDAKLALDSFIENNLDNYELIKDKYDTTLGFINEKTIYRVKKDEK